MSDERTAKCRACGTEFTSAAWSGLALSARLAPQAIRENVLGWPDHLCVEVRVCSHCQGRIAVKRSTAPL